MTRHLRILTWNLFHGRALPPAGRDLFDEFAAALRGREWDVALLQEVPPWWPAELGRACGASAASVLTSRNSALWLRRAIARRRPDLIKSNGGGANAILVRGETPVEHRGARLRWRPERRSAHGVRLASGLWVVNLHASTSGRAPADVAEARSLALSWSAGAPVVLGGDLNWLRPELPGFERAAEHRIDGVWVRGLSVTRPGEVLDAGRLSDHAPVRATVAGVT